MRDEDSDCRREVGKALKALEVILGMKLAKYLNKVGIEFTKLEGSFICEPQDKECPFYTDGFCDVEKRNPTLLKRLYFCIYNEANKID